MDKHFSKEYLEHVSMSNPNWRWRRRFAMIITLGRDTCFPFLRADQADHLDYRNLGRELPLRDIVPLNRYVHALVTKTRKGIWKWPINLFLRSAYSIWIILWIFAIWYIVRLSLHI